MRHINFIEVGMENYGPYTDPMVLTFGQDQIIMIIGPNGIGKTMAMDAICFAFYGMTSKGLRADDVVNNVKKKNCKVWVKFNINKDEYIVTRYQKYKKLGSTVMLRRNGVDIKKGHKEVLPEIERLICTRKSYLNTLMFGQKVKDFFTDLTDNDKKEIFRSILDLDKYKKYYERCNQIIKKILENLREIEDKIIGYTGQITVAKDVIERTDSERILFLENQKRDMMTYQNAISECNRIMKKWEEELEEYQKPDIESIESNLSEAKSQLEKYHSSLENANQKLDNNRESKINDLHRMASSKLAEINDVLYDVKDKTNSEIMKLKDELNTYTEKNTEKRMKYGLANNGCQEKIVGLEARISEIEINVIQSSDSKCPLCEQAITEDKKKELENLIENYQDDIRMIEGEMETNEYKRKKLLEELKNKADEINNQIAELSSDLKLAEANRNKEEIEIEKRLKAALSKVDKTYQSEQKKIQDQFSQDVQDASSKIQELETLKQKAKETIEAITNIEKNMEQLRSDISYNEMALKRKQEQEYDESQANEYKKRLYLLSTRIKSLKDESSDLKNEMEIFEFWKAAFSSTGIPSMLIDEAIPFMNKRVDYYLNMLTNGRYMVSFDTMDQTKSGTFRDKISVKVFDSVTRADNRLQFSGGQTRIVDIATILTLGDLQSNIQNIKFNLLIFDEIFDSLDEKNIDYVSRVMTKLKIGKSIYIISHRHVDQLEADEVLEFK